MSNPWKVVIVGGGFGGLYAAQQLKSSVNHVEAGVSDDLLFIRN